MNNDKHILACISRSTRAEHVADYATWASRRLGAPLEFLHMIGLHANVEPADDRSGAIGVDAQDHLLSKLTADDERSARLLREQAREHLHRLRLRALASGAGCVDGRLRYGELEETLAETKSAAGMVVIGRHAGKADNAHGAVDVERIVRASSVPVLTVTGEFREPVRALIAFDGSAASRRGVQMVAASALFSGMHVDLLMSGPQTATALGALREAQELLEASGRTVDVSQVQGDLESAIDVAVAQHPVDLLVMGSYSHSPIRSLLAGSKTTRLLRAFPIPTLLMR